MNWICEYCSSPQKVERVTCSQCGAPCPVPKNYDEMLKKLIKIQNDWLATKPKRPLITGITQ